jgi:hypothetical protein
LTLATCITSALTSFPRHRVEAALRRTEPDLEWRASQLDFAVANTLDRAHVRFLRPRRGLESLTHRLEAQLEALDEFSGQLPAETAADLETRKGHLSWLLSELRRGL